MKNIDALTTSHQGMTDQGFNYGIYETGLSQYYQQGVGYRTGHHFACVEVKFPGAIQDWNMDPIMDGETNVFVKVNLNMPRANTCDFVK